MPCYSPLKGYKDVDTGGWISRRQRPGQEKMDVACGQCLGCRLDRSRMWAVRCVHEASLHERDRGNCFITLTYRDPVECTLEQLAERRHVPEDWSLNLSHFVGFMKRLRSSLSHSIKFFHCGEYGKRCRHGFEISRTRCPIGCKVGRPHYHALLFNHRFDDLEQYGQRDGEPRWTSPTLEKLWGYGFVDCGELTFESAAYVARYVLKKRTGSMADEHYSYIDDYGNMCWLRPEYVTMSRGGRTGKGLAHDWYSKFKGDLFPSDEVPVPGPQPKVLKKVPRYYEQMLRREDEEAHEKLKAMRLAYRQEHEAEYDPARLEAKYKCKKAQTKTLERTL